MGYMERCSRHKPCVMCGDVGYDMRIVYDDETVHWCHKVLAQKGEVGYFSGEEYICRGTKQIEAAGMGEFSLWVKYVPDWKPARTATVRNMPAPKKTAATTAVLANKKLDAIYRAMLQMLTLEEWHKESLLREWKSPVYDVSGLIDTYIIRSLPPKDTGRPKGKNPTRKALVGRLFDMFGGLEGVPGFYRRSGEYWDNKPEKEKWTIAFPNSGMIFPCYDQDGYMYRIRVRDDLPDLEVKENYHKPYKGMYGAFHRYQDYRSGEIICQFIPKENPQERVICRPEEAYGKPRGKYKNFSSTDLDGGCGSGSPISLYTLPGDNNTIALITEGEKKAMVGNGVKHIPCVSLPGVGAYNLLFSGSMYEFLKNRGVRIWIVCYDADKSSNKNVRACEDSLCAELKRRGEKVFIGEWSEKFSKGLDDILLEGVELSLRPV